MFCIESKCCCVIQFQTDLQSILISLIDVAQTLVCLSPNDLDEAKSKCFSESSDKVNGQR